MRGGRGLPITVKQLRRLMEQEGFRRSTDKGIKLHHPQHPQWGFFDLGYDPRDYVNKNVAQRVGRCLGYQGIASLVDAVRRW